MLIPTSARSAWIFWALTLKSIPKPFPVRVLQRDVKAIGIAGLGEQRAGAFQVAAQGAVLLEGAGEEVGHVAAGREGVGPEFAVALVIQGEANSEPDEGIADRAADFRIGVHDEEVGPLAGAAPDADIGVVLEIDNLVG